MLLPHLPWPFCSEKALGFGPSSQVSKAFFCRPLHPVVKHLAGQAISLCQFYAWHRGRGRDLENEWTCLHGCYKSGHVSDSLGHGDKVL